MCKKLVSSLTRQLTNVVPDFNQVNLPTDLTKWLRCRRLIMGKVVEIKNNQPSNSRQQLVPNSYSHLGFNQLLRVRQHTMVVS